MREQKRIRSVLELARYKVGDVAWWVIMRPIKAPPELTDDQAWMAKPNVHPKALYKPGGPFNQLWPGKAILPKLQHVDFTTIIGLLTSELMVEQFPICDLIRSSDTGEFFYANENDEWMPEVNLMDTKIAADRERARIIRLLQRWTNGIR